MLSGKGGRQREIVAMKAEMATTILPGEER